ncbi:MAG TPA: HNH endonuclease signature motif containing protein [Candidatus Elarobacter sp.]
MPPLPYGSKALREILVELAGERCQRCGWAERHPQTRRVPLEIDHIDGDWKNTSAGNTRVLCPNCHALTPNFRGLNRGNGRPGRGIPNQRRRKPRLIRLVLQGGMGAAASLFEIGEPAEDECMIPKP